jgi:hypothetical protein
MADERYLEQLIAEFRRVGIDPDTFSAMLAVNRHDALRALKSLPDGAGPAAFLKELRHLGLHAPPPSERSPEHSGGDAADRASGAA